MSESGEFILGEFHRTLDDRWRLSIPSQLAESLAAECILAKERPGCVSLWSGPTWQSKELDHP